MLTIDARPYLEANGLTQARVNSRNPISSKPGILLTGAHHSRELASIQMPLYSVLRLLQGGIVNNQPKFRAMLAQNKYYIVPVVNVDGLAFIEDQYLKTGEISLKRKNMNLKYLDRCEGDLEATGVDLNRNYGVAWDKPGGSSPDPCEENFRGDEPFSEPETRAIRDFLVSHQ